MRKILSVRVLRLVMGILPFYLFTFLPLSAQPSWVKKATKSVLTLKTFTADGTLLGSANGFYVGKSGEAISCYAPFKGAQRAVVIDATGKEYEVACILGANETYDVAKFRVTTGKTQPLTVAQGSASTDASVWLLPYNQVKKVPQGTVRKAETFNQSYAYYTVALQMPENSVGAPLLSEAGEVLGLMQQPASLKDTLNYAVSALFADSLKTTGLSINDPVLRATGIRKALPQDVGQAQLALYIGGASLDSLAYCQLIEDFILQFPNHPDGYTYRAQQLVNGSRFDDADRDMKKALKVAEKPDEVHYTYSRLMLQKLLYMPEQNYDAWSFDGSFDEAGEAYRINPLPTYRQQQAVVRYAQQRFDDAYAIYEELFASSLRSPELFYAASVCKEQLKDSVAQLALLDSCVAQFSRPYLKETAPYLLHRAQLLMDMNRHREAVTDLNDYESLMKTFPDLTFNIGECLNADPFELALSLVRYGFKVDEIYATLAPEKFRYVSKLADISPDTKIFCNMEPTMLYYDVSASRAHISLGKDAAFYCPDIPNIAWNSDVQPFGFQGITKLMETIKETMKEARA